MSASTDGPTAPVPPPQDRQFEGRVAVVTGGTQGLGEATARLMAARGLAGAVLVGRDRTRGRTVAEALSRSGCRAEFVAVDLAEADAPARIMAAADAAFGRVDTLVNAAALTVRGSVWDADPDLWTTMLAVNTRAPALLITEAARLMVRNGTPGTVVSIGSVAAHGGQDFLYPYSASKLALQAITRNAAFSLMRHRIRVNLLQPGWMNTPGEHEIQQRFHGADPDGGWLAEASARQPFGRLLDPDEVARAICFLASDESGMMTGATIDVDQTITGAGDAPDAHPGPGVGRAGPRRHRHMTATTTTDLGTELTDIGIGLLGAGRIGSMHARLIQHRVVGARLTGVFDVTADAAELVVPGGGRPGVRLGRGPAGRRRRRGGGHRHQHRHPRRPHHRRRRGRQGHLLREAHRPRAGPGG